MVSLRVNKNEYDRGKWINVRNKEKNNYLKNTERKHTWHMKAKTQNVNNVT